VNKKHILVTIQGTLLMVCTVAAAVRPAKTQPSAGSPGEFRVASAAFDRGEYATAAELLERVVAHSPASFEAREMLGLTYAALSRPADAVRELRAAVVLQPKSALAHANLATSLMRVDRPEEAEAEARKGLALDPTNYDATRRLAGIYLHSNRVKEAIPLLLTAQRLRSDAYDNGYDLAMAYLLDGQPTQAQRLTNELLRQKPSGELHNLAGRIAETQGRYVDAVNEFAAAAHQDPNEENLFTWGSELLAHRTYVSAIEVFRTGTQRFPESSRMLVGLGMALYARGDYEESVRALLKGADASPSDPRSYFYLSKAYLSAPSQADAVVAHFRRYAELEPKNGRAQFYYGMSLWKSKRAESTAADLPMTEALLKRALTLDDTLAEAHLQLGILYTEQHEDEKARPQYERALQLDPQSSDAHFRMGRYYLHAGNKEQAEQEFVQFRSLQAQHHAAEDEAKAKVQQFVVTAPAASSAQPRE
jgi:tetratricopeptide (TPR) repeat protein